MRSIVMVFLWLVMMSTCCCGAVKSEVENSEKDLIDLEKYGVACDGLDYVYLLKGDTLCAIDRVFLSDNNYDKKMKSSYMIKLFYSIKTISTPTTLNITDYTLDEKKSYIEFDDEYINYINTMEGCLFENRKYSVNCYHMKNALVFKIPKYLDKDRCYFEDDYYSYSYSIDDIAYKMNSELHLYAPKPNDILFYSYSIYDSKNQLWFNTPSSNGYMIQSVDDDDYQFSINEETDLILEQSDSFSVLISPKNNEGVTIGYVRLDKDDNRICYSKTADNYYYIVNSLWSDFYINECVYKMSKSDLIEKFGNIYKQLSSSFDNNLDNAITEEKRILEDKRSNIEKKKELSTQECYYYETLSGSYYYNYEGYFVKENTFILIFVDRYYNNQFKVIIPITDQKSISLKDMNCKESEIELYTGSKVSFEKYYGNCDIDNNEILRYNLYAYIDIANYSFSSVDKTITYNYYDKREISLKTTTCEVFDQTIPRITNIFPPIPKDKVVLETYEDKFIQNNLYTNGICFECRDGYARISDSVYHMIEGIDDKYFKGRVEFFNLSKYENDFDSNPVAAIENVKSKYKSNRENDPNDPNEEIEYNTEDNYDELYKGNGITDGISALISKDKMILISENGEYFFVYSYSSGEEGEKTMFTLRDMDEEKSYITIREDDKITCEITPGLYNCKTIKEKCGDEYNSILENAQSWISIPNYIENNKLYYQNNYENEGYVIYEISNADIHYKIDHPRVKDYPIKSYEIWSWHKVYGDGVSGYVLQTNTSLLRIIDNCGYYICYYFAFYNYSFNQKVGSMMVDAEDYKIRFFHLVENDSRICFENANGGSIHPFDYLVNECYRVKKPEEVLKQFKEDYPGLIQKAKKNIEEELNRIASNEVKSIKENGDVNEKKLRKEEEKGGYYYEYYYNEYTNNYNGNDDRYKHYRGYFITSNQFILIYQYGGDINRNNPEDIYQIKLIFDITSNKNFSIYDFNCELSEIELPCSGEEDCPNSKKSFKEYFDNCNNKDEMNVYLNDLVDTNIYINIENRIINITDYYEVFLIIPLQERDLSLLKQEISIITKNTRGVTLDKSYDSYLYNEDSKILYNILKITDAMIVVLSKNDSSGKGMEIIIRNATESIEVRYFNSYYDFDYHTFTFPNSDYCMSYKREYHNWINKGRYPFINDYNEAKQKLLSNLETQFNVIYEDVFNSMKDEPNEDKTESPDVTIKPTEINDEGNIMKISISLLISMIMIMMILI